jgi:molecular chaperone DnaK
MQATQAVGIDLGTTYSCIAALNEHGEPFSIPNPEGEASTPSVVFFENGEEIVGFEALRNAVAKPHQVVQNAKRYMGDPKKRWTIDGKSYSPTDISAIILRQLLSNAEKQLRAKITQAVITVPAQFNDAQRAATAEAGRKAGLKQIDIINEPVAAALCYVLGTEGIWFSELANDQTILVYDLGGGTFDLSLVRYKQDEVRVLASTGDLHLGGIDFNEALLNDVADQFAREFKTDPRDEPESLQYLAIEVEQAKRSLTARPRTPLSIQHAGKRKLYQIDRERFNQLTSKLVKQTEEITLELLKAQKMGWAKVDVVLMTGGSSRMQSINDMLKRLSGRTINTSLSPDQSIAHGATYYAGMLLSKSEFVKSILTSDAAARFKKVQQKSVTARGLGILIRDLKTNTRIPYYLIDANTTLPASQTQMFGTVVENQRRVHLQIVESGARPELPYVQLGNCVIEDLPKNLKRDSEIAVTISYDESARVHLSAKEVKSGKEATIELIRTENLVAKDIEDDEDDLRIELGNEQVSNAAEQTMIQKNKPLVNVTPSIKPQEPVKRPAVSGGVSPAATRPTSSPAGTGTASSRPGSSTPPARPAVKPAPSTRALDLESADIPIALCGNCGEPLSARGVCTVCEPANAVKKPVPPTTGRPVPRPGQSPASTSGSSVPPKPGIKPAGSPAASGARPVPTAAKPVGSKPPAPQPFDDDDIIDLFGADDDDPPAKASMPSAKPTPKPAPRPVPPAGQNKPGVRPMPQPQPQPKKRPEIPLDD